MTEFTFTSNHRRLNKLRLKNSLAGGFARSLLVMSIGMGLLSLVLLIVGTWLALSAIGLAIWCLTLWIWIRADLGPQLPVSFAHSNNLAEILPPEIAQYYRPDISTTELVARAQATWDGNFVLLRLGLEPLNPTTNATVTVPPHDVFVSAVDISQKLNLPTVSNASIVAAAFLKDPALHQQFVAAKLTEPNLLAVVVWAWRLGEIQQAHKPLYGGLARDWSSGFVPLLNRYGTSISSQVEFAGKYFSLRERTTGLDTLIANLTGPTGSAALVGETGIGKSSLILGLADRLLQGLDSGRLAGHQVYSLNASVLLSEATNEGGLENLVMSLFGEATAAGNIVIALDEAQLFFGQGTGAVNLSHVLLPYLGNNGLPLVLAFTPGEWQKLKSTAPSASAMLTPLILTEPDESSTMAILADRALLLEPPGVTVTFQGLQAAYRLSGRYLQEEAYPGKALKVLEAAVPYVQSGLVTAESITSAIEQQYGVRAGAASPAESNVLLELESKIHERMVNQTRAVGVVANALRRARAGVSNPKRPIGSFLFLGPTGVGKTELARSLAAVYFGSEASIIRLDMSEYQQVADVDRLLEDADTNSGSFLTKIRATPFSVVLFDEIEKAHPNILNLFLQLLDEGNLSDLSGHPASFKDAIIIATSNAGADEIRERISAGQELEDFETEFTENLINSGNFRPELLNRFDEIVLFRPLKPEELVQVVDIMVAEVNRTLEPQQIKVALTPAAKQQLVDTGYDARLGARPLRRMVTRRVEDAVADLILRGGTQPGDTVTLDAIDPADHPDGQSGDHPSVDQVPDTPNDGGDQTALGEIDR